ncbi:MAG: hypothetical protein KGQ60_19010 [Planctomycetes bacterium]|nr:hypothetical protein [Planctomycetota bacterium]
MLNERIQKIAQLWKSRSQRVTTDLVQELRSLHDELEDHFREEEVGGCLDEAVARKPALGKELDQLQLEHPNLLKDLDRLIDVMAPGYPSENQRKLITAEFSRFIDRLQKHEMAEEQILEEGFGVYLS